LTECVQKEGKPYKYDVSVPLADFQKVVDAVRERMISKGLYGDHAISKVMGYGHVGDGIVISSTYPRARPLISS
jgi:FAD/FMN-containing dehydrogenase